MAKGSGEFRRTLPAFGAAVPIVILFVAVLSIVLTAAGPGGLGLSDAQISGWIVVVYGLPAVPSLVLTFRYRQPLLLTGNVFAIIFFASLGGPVQLRGTLGSGFPGRHRRDVDRRVWSHESASRVDPDSDRPWSSCRRSHAFRRRHLFGFEQHG